MDPEHIKAAMLYRIDKAIREAVHFDQARIPRQYRDIGIIAESYKPHNPLEALLSDTELSDLGNPMERSIVDPTGSLRYAKRVLPKGVGLPVSPAPDLWHDCGRVFFTDNVILPRLDYKVGDQWEVWMGLTPFELWTQRGAIRAAKGHVVIGGLGMGWLLSQVAKKKSVKKITVVEISKELISWYGQRLCDTIPKVELIHGDIWQEVRNHGKGSKFLLDVWSEYGDADQDPKLEQLREDGFDVWAWGSKQKRVGK